MGLTVFIYFGFDIFSLKGTYSCAKVDKNYEVLVGHVASGLEANLLLQGDFYPFSAVVDSSRQNMATATPTYNP